MDSVLICGTLAYDDIGEFATPLTGTTRNVKLHRLDRGFGGCAMNIAYNLAGLGHHAVPFVYAGEDYSGEYARHVARCGVSESGIFRVADATSSRGIVLTGRDGAQFTAFYPGPSGSSRWASDLDRVAAAEPFDAVVIAPDLPEKMAGCAERLRDTALRVWCPGQYAELLEPADVVRTLACCDVVVANRHEWQALVRGGTRLDAVVAVVTDGPRPVTVLPAGDSVEVPGVAPERQVDPTGCGDAFVAGLVAGLLSGVPTVRAVRAATVLAHACLAHRGAQAHDPSCRIGEFDTFAKNPQ